LDMTGYLKPGTNIHIDLIFPSPAQKLADYYINICDVYFPEVPIRSFSSLPWGGSDHSSFNNMGYQGIWSFEDIYDSSPYIHTPNDIIEFSVNNPEQVAVFTQTNLASIATLAMYDQEMPPASLVPPTNCVAQHLQGRSIKITWEAPAGNTPTQYWVYRDDICIIQVPATQLQYVNTLPYNDHNLHCYKVTALYGVRESEFSNEDCASVPNNITDFNPPATIYPNPANDKLYIESEWLNHTVEIFDINGKCIINQIIDTNITMIDISNVIQGVYFVKISNEVVGKFVKQ